MKAPVETLADIVARMGIAGDVVDVDPAEYQDMVQTKREAVWHRACQLGKCRYAVEDVSQPNPPSVDSTVVCGGYHGTRHVGADGVVTWRWRPCVRHLAWQQRRAESLATTGRSRKRPQRDLED